MLVQLLVYLVYVLRLFAVVLFDFAVLLFYVGGCVALSYFGFRLLAFYVFDIVGLGDCVAWTVWFISYLDMYLLVLGLLLLVFCSAVWFDCWLIVLCATFCGCFVLWLIVVYLLVVVCWVCC